MKPTLLISLSFLLFSLTTHFPLVFTQYAEQVKDTNGNPIFPGGKYYILPAIFGPTGGGLTLATPGGIKVCPITVFQNYSEVAKGIPVKFSIPGISPGIIAEGTPLDISFDKIPDCADSPKWLVVDDKNNSEIGPWVNIGGVFNTGKTIIDGLFKIKKHGFGYKLVFCPTATAPPGLCFDIGRHDESVGRRLILTENDPFEVEFVDASEVGIRSIV